MIWLALLLGSLGIADLVRWDTERIDLRTVVAWLVSGLVTGAVLALGGATQPLLWGTVAAITAANVAWSVAASVSSGRGRRAALPILTIVVLVVAAVLSTGGSPVLSGPLTRWYHRLQLPVLSGVPLDRFLLVVGLGLFLTSTGNVLVRLVLTAAGSTVTRSEQQIKGGRVLGPLERLLIFGLGLAGQLAAASIIVAAKGLLRFPELQSYRQDLEPRDRPNLGAQRIDTLTEYFLIGSLTSWALALACLVLV